MCVLKRTNILTSKWNNLWERWNFLDFAAAALEWDTALASALVDNRELERTLDSAVLLVQQRLRAIMKVLILERINMECKQTNFQPIIVWAIITSLLQLRLSCPSFVNCGLIISPPESCSVS